jgi:hypothetical protein
MDGAHARRRITVRALPAARREAAAVAMLVARALGLPFGEARALLGRLPAALPKVLDTAGTDSLVIALEAAGATVGAAPVEGEVAACEAHPSLDAAETCTRCGAAICAICAATSAPPGRCRACAGRARRSRAFFRIRVAALLVVLAGVLLYAYEDVSRRRARNEWTRTLAVGLVVARRGPVDDAAVGALRDRARALEDLLAAEAERYRGPGGPRPFEVVVFGPVNVTQGPPAPEGDGVIDLARYAYAKARYAARIDEAAGVTRGLDVRIYLVARPGREGAPNFVEGSSEQGGRAGFVEVDLHPTMVDFALFVFAHELGHTLGATDKYDDAGATMIPSGLAEPDAVPRFPQRFVELMARGRPTGPGTERPPDSLRELRVGPVTAREIGWSTTGSPGAPSSSAAARTR